MDQTRFTGGCLCGAVRFQGRTLSPGMAICHCEQCRRWSGFYWAGFAATGLQITGTALRWFASSAEAERGFCGQCGSSLFWRRKGQDKIDVAPGAIDMPAGADGNGLHVTGHIYTAFKGDYYQITDGLPQARRE